MIYYIQISVFFNSTGCLKKTWTFFEIGIILLFVEEYFQNFAVGKILYIAVRQ